MSKYYDPWHHAIHLFFNRLVQFLLLSLVLSLAVWAGLLHLVFEADWKTVAGSTWAMLSSTDLQWRTILAQSLQSLQSFDVSDLQLAEMLTSVATSIPPMLLTCPPPFSHRLPGTTGETGSAGGGRCGVTPLPQPLPMRVCVAAMLACPSALLGRCAMRSAASRGSPAGSDAPARAAGGINCRVRQS
ncbi:MAG: hypothetical protein J7598_22520 [Mitsuaria chitosanitabida]|uniref:hypothetical protein n=1 Tax=Roseateles chitosanitabidus TaxID=65048 RepID=UPI001B10E56F|nr:hypothetical protein [Roseateles chitosanitabidus]MBO9689386.1 hypothetical protein [Roseateles chitosanitabidus]